MNQRLNPLFTPWKIGSCEIKNRIVLTSMGGTDLFGWMEKNHFDRDGARFILEVAQNNVGLVLPGCQPVYNPMFGQWLYKNKKMYRDLKEWMPEFHKTGAKLFVQLTAGFGRSFTVSSMMETLYTNKLLRAVSKPFMDLDKITATASPSPNRWSDKVPSRAMTVEEIHEFVEAFAKTARLLQEAGVDGVEVHAVHEGYLLDQFTLGYVNKRTDEYGGSFENRYRFPVEIVQAIKKACGKEFPVSLRYSVISKTKGFRQGALPGEEYTEVGRAMEESERAAKYLQDAGYDMPELRQRHLRCLVLGTPADLYAGKLQPGRRGAYPAVCGHPRGLRRPAGSGGRGRCGGGRKAGRRGLRAPVPGGYRLGDQAHGGPPGGHPSLHPVP